MTDATLTPPARLRQAIATDLRPVRPLPPPGRRVLAMLPAALLVLLAAPTVFWLRVDAAALGGWVLWGLSVAQGALGVALVRAALVEAVPGRQDDARVMALMAAGVLLVVGVTVVSASFSLVPLRAPVVVGAMCFAGSLTSALPLVAIAGVLAARAFPLRPAVAGALYGLGAGLVADAGWRLFCEFGAPSHVLVAHLGAVLAAMGLGAALATLLARRAATTGSPTP
jgi:uncharacterized membrane protein YgdD (TMEM256/DUF423 family)